MKIPEIFETQNLRLAAALIFAGFTPHDVQRRYTTADERKLGKRARDLTQQNMGGTGVVQFERTPELEAVVNAYGEQQKAGDKLDLRPDEPEWTITPEERAKIAYFVMRVHSDIAGMLKNPANAFICEQRGKPTAQTQKISVQSEEREITIPTYITIPPMKLCKDLDHLRQDAGIPHKAR